jgi:osmotically-inducible protein OsmY
MITDHQLQQHVVEELEFEPQVDAAHIGVTAKNGVVTLTGFVSSYAEKVAAEAAVRRVTGVKAIAEEIAVRLPNDKKWADDEIAERAVSILRWDDAVPNDRIQVKVENGIVTLYGTVEWQYQKNEAGQAVHKLSGVVGVVNTIRVQSPVPATAVTQQIYKALARDARTEASQVTVETDNGVVTLRGMVRNWHEREVIERAAWSVPGVSEIRDQLTLSWGD